MADAATQPIAAAARNPFPRLATMMFLQFFVWGGWYVTLGPFMAANGMKNGIGDAYSVSPIAAIISPFFLGMVADRFFASQKVLALLHMIGAFLIFIAPWAAIQAPLHDVVNEAGVVTGQARDHTLFVGVLLAYTLCYMPTLGLANTVAFHHIQNPEKQFPIIRVLGTIGWIVAGFAIGYTIKGAVPDVKAIDGTAEAIAAAKTQTEQLRAASPIFFYITGVASALLGAFSLALPNTPPPAKGKPFSARDAIGVDALSLLRNPSFAVFCICSMLTCIPLSTYYAFAGIYVGKVGFTNVAVTMTFGQMSEIFFMVTMPMFFARLGVKWMLAVGMLAWAVRYGLFAGAWGGDSADSHIKWLVLGGILLHGICYDFFIVTGQIYVDRRAPARVRAQAQGFLVLLTYGVGMLIGAQVAQQVFTATNENWPKTWGIAAGIAAVIFVVFAIAFRDRAGPPADEGTPAETTP